jgi:hypothetical protein
MEFRITDSMEFHGKSHVRSIPFHSIYSMEFHSPYSMERNPKSNEEEKGATVAQEHLRNQPSSFKRQVR